MNTYIFIRAYNNPLPASVNAMLYDLSKRTLLQIDLIIINDRVRSVHITSITQNIGCLKSQYIHDYLQKRM